eukprot:GHVT01047948.1.p1 GENE.GHVT01047948.1~~GHVT01047948.1.p1  ORF type:complete len:114 (+),score=3.39 GHVT01047948.1:2443-2784(+)
MIPFGWCVGVVSGIVKACIIGLGRGNHGRGGINHRVRVSVRDKADGCDLPSRTPYGVIIRRRKETRRKDGSYIKFEDNAFVVIAKNKLKGTQIKGPVPYELRHSCKYLARTLV